MIFKRAYFILSLLFVAQSLGAAVPDFQSEYDKAKSQIIESDEKQREVLGSFFQINLKLKKLVGEKAKTTDEKQMLEKTTRDLAQKIIELDQKHAEQKKMLQIRLSAIYKFGGQGFARMLFSSSNPADLDRNLKILGVVAKNDLVRLKEFSTLTKDLESKRVKFTGRLAKLRKTEALLAGQESEIKSQANQKNLILANMKKNKELALNSIKKLRGRVLASDQPNPDDELLDLLLKPSFYESKGQLSAPVQGRVLRGFGLWKDPEFEVSLSHKGLLYSVARNQEVKAVFSGRVAFLGTLAGFGKAVVVDHGDHYYSVYSGEMRPSVSEGEELSEGQQIASVDEKLYFEIRHFSEPSDPLQWLKGKTP